MKYEEQMALLNEFNAESCLITEKWESRGLVPSPIQTKAAMLKSIESFASWLRSEIKPEQRMNGAIVAKKFDVITDSVEFDTEERQMICDILEELCRKVDVPTYDPYPNKAEIKCPNCTTRARVPVIESKIMVTCPSCTFRFPVRNGGLEFNKTDDNQAG